MWGLVSVGVACATALVAIAHDNRRTEPSSRRWVGMTRTNALLASFAVLALFAGVGETVTEAMRHSDESREQTARHTDLRHQLDAANDKLQQAESELRGLAGKAGELQTALAAALAGQERASRELGEAKRLLAAASEREAWSDQLDVLANRARAALDQARAAATNQLQARRPMHTPPPAHITAPEDIRFWAVYQVGDQLAKNWSAAIEALRSHGARVDEITPSLTELDAALAPLTSKLLAPRLRPPLTGELRIVDERRTAIRTPPRIDSGQFTARPTPVDTPQAWLDQLAQLADRANAALASLPRKPR